MMSPHVAGGMIVALEAQVAPELRRLGRSRSFTVLESDAAYQAFQHVRGGRRAIFIVQVGSEGREALEFIRLAAATPRNAPLIAVATHHSTRLEREALCAGATYYVPGVAPALLDPILDAVLAADMRE